MGFMVVFFQLLIGSGDSGNSGQTFHQAVARPGRLPYNSASSSVDGTRSASDNGSRRKETVEIMEWAASSTVADSPLIFKLALTHAHTLCDRFAIHWSKSRCTSTIKEKKGKSTISTFC